MSRTSPHLDRLRLLRPFAARLCAGLACMAVTVLIQLAYPKALSYFIDNINVRKDIAWFSSLALIMLAVLAVQAAAATARFYIFESTGHMIVTRIRRQLYAALIDQPIRFYDKHHVGELNNRLTADVEILHDTLTMGMAVSLRCLCVFIGGVAMLLTISPALCLMLVVFLPATLYIGKMTGKVYRKRARLMQDGQAECGKVAHEHFSNIRLVHAFSQQRTARERYAAATGHALSLSVSSSALFALFRGGSSFLVYLALLGTLWFGARLIGQGVLSVGDLTAFILYASMVTEAAGAIGEFWNAWMRTIGATEWIFEVINSERAADTAAGGEVRLQGQVTFDDVVFSYPERPDAQALNSVGFSIAAGETIALVGASGAGKSTIASLILGFYRPDSGSIAFDGIDAGAMPLAGIRSKLAIVEQEPSLFSGSIFENIAFAVAERDVTLDEVKAAAILACAHDFISAFPDGYLTLVGERGAQLSGGQKQRIAIARALLRDPRILILDEATSALDSASEVQVQRALDTLMQGRTTIIIAHRFSTIVKADRILVLNQGRVAQQGTHAQLVAEQDGLYFHLMRHQLARAGTQPQPA
ncbi:ABC transporter ATP-binding protein [Massilia antarctica]|uniref:ABC transporter ATP-binding protein n=1 Tax=Massilia antarctica TaxID=2765360 RepID=UPI0006BB76E5|nr:ABC transporter transmembrane domain-containing protein [Massilia sp. H27-R4]CUI09578.1 Lipid A export ATP-binding/permease protein MsbA [Janthinobacterium sp. CG23_2]CUU33364.1 Lipid A export ATP-binding/permease protein MsbA [Janthinobacterium sp. CG23_2]